MSGRGNGVVAAVLALNGGGGGFRGLWLGVDLLLLLGLWLWVQLRGWCELEGLVDALRSWCWGLLLVLLHWRSCVSSWRWVLWLVYTLRSRSGRLRVGCWGDVLNRLCVLRLIYALWSWWRCWTMLLLRIRRRRWRWQILLLLLARGSILR